MLTNKLRFYDNIFFALQNPTFYLRHVTHVPVYVNQLVNHFEVKPEVIGTYSGKCFELCGVYHSRMLFNVDIVSQADYEQYLADLEASGQVADQPLLGGANANTQAGLDSGTESDGVPE